MNVHSIVIQNINTSGLKADCEGLEHIKTLPCLSIVQAFHGRYEVSIDGSPIFDTSEGGIFSAPAKSHQRIIHHNGSNNYMEAHWIFMNVIINDYYRIEDLFHLPIILPPEHNKEIYKLICSINDTENICQKYSSAYRITDILLSYSTPYAQPDETMLMIQKYISEHYNEKIKAEDIAKHMCCSVPQLYRLFQKHFSLSPANYFNDVRLQNAALMLEEKSSSISEIASSCGFDDISYFSKLFKQKFGICPSDYRSNLHGFKI